jgi:putative intracellular protease/amidase
MKKLGLIAGTLAVLVGLFLVALPTLLHTAGLHPTYPGEAIDLSSKRALVIATNHGVLNAPGETTGDPTGVMASELTIAYYKFLDAGMDVDVASVKGGKIPIDPQTLLFMIKTPEDNRFLDDPDLQAKVTNSKRIDDLDFTQYDIIFMSGGWGAAYDLGYSEVLGDKISDAYAAQTPIIGSVCHGALGLINARDTEGAPLIAGRRIAGVTNKQLEELGIKMTPMHPETELRNAGAVYESRSAFLDFFATHVAIDDERRFVTGQNQNSAHETAYKMMVLAAEAQR